jgi:hypothetical protein
VTQISYLQPNADCRCFDADHSLHVETQQLVGPRASLVSRPADGLATKVSHFAFVSEKYVTVYLHPTSAKTGLLEKGLGGGGKF